MVEIGVQYTPNATGEDVGTLQIYKDAVDPANALFIVGLVGSGVRPSLIVDTNTVDFGGVPVEMSRL